jgi:hypothetical protein
VLVAFPVGLIVVVVVVDILAPPDVHLGPLLVAAPAMAAALGGARLVASIGALAVVAQLIIALVRRGWITLNHEMQILALVVVTAVIMLFCRLRERQQRQLTQVRSVSEAAQRVLLRPLPRCIGPLKVASVYLAAEAEAHIGGDLYAAARTDDGTRLVIGDVRGKGLSSISDAAVLLGAFREAAHQHATLAELTRYLEGSVSRGLAELAETDHDADEDFVTAAVLDIPDDEPVIHLVDCGHPRLCSFATASSHRLRSAGPNHRWASANSRTPATASKPSPSRQATSCCSTPTASSRPATAQAPSTRSPSGSHRGRETAPRRSCDTSAMTCSPTATAAWATTQP